MEKRSLKALGDVLSQSTALNDAKRLSWQTWRGVVGLRIANKTRPEFLDKQVLTVRVASPMWAQELSLLQGTILQRLAEAGLPVRQLRFRVGKVEAPRTRKLPPQVAPAPLPAELTARLAQVEDPELQEAIARAAGYSLARRK